MTEIDNTISMDTIIKCIGGKTNIDISDILNAIETDEHGNASVYLVDRIFNVGLGYVPEDFQKSYIDLALFYFKSQKISEQENDQVIGCLGYLSHITNVMLKPETKRSESTGYETNAKEVAKEMYAFIDKNKNDLTLLNKVLDPLFKALLYLNYSPAKIGKEVEPSSNFLQGILDEKGHDMLYNPLIIKEIWTKCSTQ
ncbi:MAG: hypothetical protein ABIC04_07435 [Nanoarchaeota archaeon]